MLLRWSLGRTSDSDTCIFYNSAVPYALYFVPRHGPFRADCTSSFCLLRAQHSNHDKSLRGATVGAIRASSYMLTVVPQRIGRVTLLYRNCVSAALSYTR